MKWFRNLKTGTKIIALVILMAIFLSGVGFTGYYYSEQANKITNILYTNKLQAISWIKEARADNRNAQIDAYLLFLAPLTKENAQKALADLNDRTKQYDEDIANYMKTNPGSLETEKTAKFNEELKAFRDERAQALQMAFNSDKLGGYNNFMDKAAPHMDNTDAILAELSAYTDQTAKQLMEDTNQKFAKSIKFVIGISAFAVMLALVIGLTVGRMISVPLSKVVANVNDIANGNLTIEDVKLDSKDEIGVLAKAINSMAANLRGLIGQVAVSAEQVASSSEELTASAEQQALATNQVAMAISDVAVGTEKQSNAIDETSTAIEQISAAIQQAAANSNEVAEQAAKSSLAAQEGQKVVDKVVGQMDKISRVTEQVHDAVEQLATGSKKIGEITDVISGIASQTNLLALNAAIEAARAGEQGRGFAVVAEEVRKLAEQSSEAAKQITFLIANNQADIDNAVSAMQAGAKDVKTGIDVVSIAGETFLKVADAINQVVGQIHEVSVTVEKMADGSQHIVSAIKQIENISKDNLGQSQNVSAATEEQSASVEQIASASQSLAGMAQDLQIAVGKFRV